MDQTTDRFLLRIGLHPDTVDLSSCIRAFLNQMHLGLCGKPSSLLMLPAWVTTMPPPTAEKKAIAVDIGGTNLRVALVHFSEAGPQILEQTTQPVYGKTESITADCFFSMLAQNLSPYLEQTRSVGICFSFPAESRPDLDARILSIHKEIRITGAEGLLVAEELKKHLPVPVETAVVNDTAAALLGGSMQAGEYDGLIGFVLGTGTNTCYEEKIGRIKKITGSSSMSMLINTESAGFAEFPRGALDERLDGTLASPGAHLLEKAVSGTYLGRLICLALQEAANGKLLGPNFQQLPLYDMSYVDGFLKNQPGPIADCCTWETDRQTARDICLGCINRAARLVAANLIAIMIQGDIGRRKPARIVAEGSTFWNCETYMQAITDQMNRYAREIPDLKWSFERINQANLIGAAAAVLGKQQTITG